MFKKLTEEIVSKLKENLITKIPETDEVEGKIKRLRKFN